MAADTAPARRHFVVGLDDTGRFDRDGLLELMVDMASVLTQVGGQIVFAAQRAKIDEIAGEPVAMTTQVVGEWQAHSALPFEDWTVSSVEAVASVAPVPPVAAGVPLDELGEPEEPVEQPSPSVSAPVGVAHGGFGDPRDDPSLVPASIAEAARG